jgi:glycosyltransferase involved in cell wall biosynthesis
MRILHVIGSLAERYGGTSKVCAELCDELARRGEQVTIYTTTLDGNQDREPVCGDNVEIRYFPVQPPRFLALSTSLARELKSGIRGFDLVHIHTIRRMPSTMAALYARRQGVPYIICPHGSLDPLIVKRHRWRKWAFDAAIENANLNGAAALHFTSTEELELTRPLGLKPPAIVVPCGIRLQDYEDVASYGGFHDRFPQTRGKRLVLFLGRLTYKKGLDVLAGAFGRLCRERDDVHLVIAGPDDEAYTPKVMRWLASENVGDRATFTGMLLGADKLAALAAADVFVLPSYSENFGVAVIEAMACRLPVVISDRVNIWREVKAAGAGIATRADAGETAQALAAVLGNAELRRKMGAAGFNLVRDRFTWSIVGESMIDAYRRVLRASAESTSRRAYSALTL